MTQTARTLVAFATRWGSQLGGINSFNADLLIAFHAAFYQSAQVVCVALTASHAEIESARRDGVTLLSLRAVEEKNFAATMEPAAWQALQKAGCGLNENETVWLGHDRITGGVALAAAKARGGKSALIHHMSYAHYEQYADSSVVAEQKKSEQAALFSQADIVLAVGPLLRDALQDMLRGTQHANAEAAMPMLVPGLAEIKALPAPKTFSAFLSGRLTDDASKIKQARLGVAGFAEAIRQCDEDSAKPDALRGQNQPRLTLRGVDFENSKNGASSGAEQALRGFAQQHAGRVVTIHALPFTDNRQTLFKELSGASVALMPSWHEGFGLVAWEAIAAGVPLIVSNTSGVYALLKDHKNSMYLSLVHPIEVLGDSEAPFFQLADKHALAKLLHDIAKDPAAARSKAAQLREILSSEFTWAYCARQFAAAVGWEQAVAATAAPNAVPPLVPQQFDVASQGSSAHAALELPRPFWTASAGRSDSQLLHAEEAVIPFDPAREPFLKTQLDWAHGSEYPVAVRLLTGQGGVGKTRLALELCERLQAEDWVAGFVKSDCDVRGAEVLGRDIAQSAQNACVVFDYAETRQSLLIAFLKSAQKQPKHKVRVLLLARDGGEWWDKLAEKDTATEALLMGTASSGPFSLPELHDGDAARNAAYQVALHIFADRLQIAPPTNQPSLAEAHFAHPLYIQMAALLALQGERSISAEALPRALINHERRYWRKALAGQPGFNEHNESQAALLMTLAVLTNGIATDRSIESIWHGARGEKALLKPLFRLLTPLYPDRQGLQGLRPDLLGEALVAQTLLDDDGEAVLSAVLAEGGERERRTALTVVARLLRYRTDIGVVMERALAANYARCGDALVRVCIETPSAMSKLAATVFDRLPESEQSHIAGLIKRHFEFEVVQLAELDTSVSRALLAKAAEKYRKRPQDTDSQIKYAIALQRMSANELRNEDDQAALRLSAENLKIRKRLARSTSAPFERMLARALDQHSTCCSLVGQHDSALLAAGDAVEIFQSLSKQNVDDLDMDFASAQTTLATCLHHDGSSAESLVASATAVEILDKTNTELDARRQRSLCEALVTHATFLSAGGAYEAALSASERGVEIARQMAAKWPERFQMSVAWALSNRAVYLSQAGRYAEAIACEQESFDVYRILAEVRPTRFLADAEDARLNLAFLNWIAGSEITQADLVETGRLGKTARIDRATAFLRSALAALKNADSPAENAVTGQAVANWIALDRTQKIDYQSMMFLIAALAERQCVATPELSNWRNEWAAYSEQRKGRIPRWLIDASVRLAIEFPSTEYSKVCRSLT